MFLADVRNYAFVLAIGFAGEILKAIDVVPPSRAHPTGKRSKSRGIINILMAQEI